MRKWTTEECQKIGQLKKEGWSTIQIAQEMKTGRGSISHVLNCRLKLNIDFRPKWTPELEQKLKILLQEKKSYRQISPILGITGHSIGQKAKQLNLQRNFVTQKLEQISLKEQGMKKCRNCNKIYLHNLINFYVLRDSYCRWCNKEMGKERYHNMTLEQVMQRAYTRIKIKCKKNNLAFDLTVDFLCNLWEKQKGLCFYSGELMEKVKNTNDIHYVFSIDKINPKKGYLQNNVVLCAWLVNAMKLDSSKEEFINLCLKIGRKHSQS